MQRLCQCPSERCSKLKVRKVGEGRYHIAGRNVFIRVRIAFLARTNRDKYSLRSPTVPWRFCPTCVRSFWRGDTWWCEWAGAGTRWSISWRGTTPVRWGPSTARARRLRLTATNSPTFFPFEPSIAVLRRNPSRPASLKAQCLFHMSTLLHRSYRCSFVVRHKWRDRQSDTPVANRCSDSSFYPQNRRNTKSYDGRIWERSVQRAITSLSLRNDIFSLFYSDDSFGYRSNSYQQTRLDTVELVPSAPLSA